MRYGRIAALALALLTGGAMGMAAAGLGPVETTSAAWTDNTYASAVVTAGTWPTTTGNSCTAIGLDGRTLTGCAVTGIRYDGWGSPGSQTRNYYINFRTPLGTRAVSFDVDLTTATGSGSSWSWEKAGVLTGAQFMGRGGWSCAQLPRLSGTGADWQTLTIYFQVAENRTGTSSVCQ